MELAFLILAATEWVSGFEQKLPGKDIESMGQDIRAQNLNCGKIRYIDFGGNTPRGLLLRVWCSPINGGPEILPFSLTLRPNNTFTVRPLPQ